YPRVGERHLRLPAPDHLPPHRQLAAIGTIRRHRELAACDPGDVPGARHGAAPADLPAELKALPPAPCRRGAFRVVPDLRRPARGQTELRSTLRPTSRGRQIPNFRRGAVLTPAQGAT